MWPAPSGLTGAEINQRLKLAYEALVSKHPDKFTPEAAPAIHAFLAGNRAACSPVPPPVHTDMMDVDSPSSSPPSTITTTTTSAEPPQPQPQQGDQIATSTMEITTSASQLPPPTQTVDTAVAPSQTQ